MFLLMVWIWIIKLNIAMGMSSLSMEDKCRKGRNACDNIYVWRAMRDEFISLSNTTYHKPYGDDDQVLRGRKIRVLVSEMYPYVMYNPQNGRLDGFIGDFWHELQTMLRFENEIIVENDFDLALDMMVNGEADVFLSTVVSNAKLNNATVYSQPFLLNWYLMGYRKSDESGSSDFFVHAFESKLLFLTLVLYLILALVLWGGLKLLTKYKPQKLRMSLPSCIIAVVGGFLNQAHELNVKFASLRMLIIVSMLFGYIIYTSLNAVLVSQLTNLEVLPPVASLEDVAVKRTHFLCVRNSSFVYNYFVDENRVLLPKWEHIVNGKGCPDIRNVRNLAAIICNRDVIILENRPLFASVFNRFPVQCNVKFLPGRLFMRYNFIVFHKSYKYEYLFAKGLKQIRSSGIMHHLEEKWFEIKSSFDAVKTSSGAIPAVNLHHVSGVLIMLLATMFLSAVILVCEIAHYRRYCSIAEIKY